MPTYSEKELLETIEELLSRRGLAWEEFMAMGRSDELYEVDPDLDFVYKHMLPHMKNPPVTA